MSYTTKNKLLNKQLSVGFDLSFLATALKVEQSFSFISTRYSVLAKYINMGSYDFQSLQKLRAQYYEDRNSFGP